MIKVKVGFALSKDMFLIDWEVNTMSDDKPADICYSMGVSEGATILVAPFTRETARVPIPILNTLHNLSKLSPSFLLEFIFRLSGKSYYREYIRNMKSYPFNFVRIKVKSYQDLSCDVLVLFKKDILVSNRKCQEKIDYKRLIVINEAHDYFIKEPINVLRLIEMKCKNYEL